METETPGQKSSNICTIPLIYGYVRVYYARPLYSLLLQLAHVCSTESKSNPH